MVVAESGDPGLRNGFMSLKPEQTPEYYRSSETSVALRIPGIDPGLPVRAPERDRAGGREREALQRGRS